MSLFPESPKVWGTEILFANEPEYTSKHLVLTPGFACSLHCHKVKKETFSVIKGWCFLELGEIPKGRRVLQEGDSLTIEPGTYHRFSSPKGAVGCTILETSTRHTDEDVFRLEESKALE